MDKFYRATNAIYHKLWLCIYDYICISTFCYYNASDKTQIWAEKFQGWLLHKLIFNGDNGEPMKQ